MNTLYKQFIRSHEFQLLVVSSYTTTAELTFSGLALQ